MDIMKRYHSHILLVIVQFKEPARYVLVNTQLVLKRKGDNSSSNDDKTSEIIKSNCANISNIQCAAIGSGQVLSMCVARFSTRNLIRKSSPLQCYPHKKISEILPLHSGIIVVLSNK